MDTWRVEVVYQADTRSFPSQRNALRPGPEDVIMKRHLSDRERAISNTWYLGISQVVGTGATYLLLLMLTRLGAERYGIWVLALLLVSYLTSWATLGLANAVVRFCPAYTSSGQRDAGYRLACRASFYFSVLIALCLMAGARPLAEIVLGGQRSLVVLAALLFPLEAQFQIGNSFLKVQERFGVYALFAILRYLSEVVVLAALVCWWPDLAVLLGAKGAILLVLVIAQHLTALDQNRGAEALPAKQELKRYLHFGLPMVPAAFIWSLLMGFDRFMLEHLGKLSEVAVYNVADALALVLLSCTQPITGILQPRFANLLHRDPLEVQRYLAGAVKYLAIFLFPGAVGMAVIATPLVRLISHPGFERATGMVPLLALAYVLIGLSNPLCHLVALQKGGKVFLGLYFLCLVVDGLLNLFLIPLYGGQGAAAATLGSFLVYFAGLLVLSDSQALKTLAGQWKTLGTILGCSLLMGLTLVAAREVHPVFDSLVLIPIGVVVYGSLVHLTGLISRRERNLLLHPLANLKVLLGARLETTRSV